MRGEDRRNVAIRSFGDGPTDYLLAAPENHLSLLDHFDERLLRPGNDWTETIMPEVRTFLSACARRPRIFGFISIPTPPLHFWLVRSWV
ncbi:hypothetical protein NKK52_31840 [Mesorhizobium sp. C277A]|uniref:hypothetical protein n=1 Tax=Mesorhizobium sp. C277A TaxID=2956827 RepID=UPI00333C76A4